MPALALIAGTLIGQGAGIGDAFPAVDGMAAYGRANAAGAAVALVSVPLLLW